MPSFSATIPGKPDILWTYLRSAANGTRRKQPVELSIKADAANGIVVQLHVVDSMCTCPECALWLFAAHTCDCCGKRERQLFVNGKDPEQAQNKFKGKYGMLRSVEAGESVTNIGRIELAFKNGNILSIGMNCQKEGDGKLFCSLVKAIQGTAGVVLSQETRCQAQYCTGDVAKSPSVAGVPVEEVPNGEEVADAERHMKELLAMEEETAAAAAASRQRKSKKSNKPPTPAHSPSNASHGEVACKGYEDAIENAAKLETIMAPETHDEMCEQCLVLPDAPRAGGDLILASLPLSGRKSETLELFSQAYEAAPDAGWMMVRKISPKRNQGQDENVAASLAGTCHCGCMECSCSAAGDSTESICETPKSSNRQGCSALEEPLSEPKALPPLSPSSSCCDLFEDASQRDSARKLPFNLGPPPAYAPPPPPPPPVPSSAECPAAAFTVDLCGDLGLSDDDEIFQTPCDCGVLPSGFQRPPQPQQLHDAAERDAFDKLLFDTETKRLKQEADRKRVEEEARILIQNQAEAQRLAKMETDAKEHQNKMDALSKANAADLAPELDAKVSAASCVARRDRISSPLICPSPTARCSDFDSIIDAWSPMQNNVMDTWNPMQSKLGLWCGNHDTLSPNPYYLIGGAVC